MDEPIMRECIVCGNHRMNGIAIIDQFICEHCETEMVNTDVLDEKYPFFIHQMRRIWLKKDA